MRSVNERTLNGIETDVARGDLGKARDRLHGLLATYPDDLTLRRKLGDIYSQLQYPAMAGRYWYLEEEKSAAMVEACSAFENACGGDPVKMLLALKFRGEIGAIGDTFAGHTLLALQERAREERNISIELGKRGREQYQHQYTRSPREMGKWWSIGCLVGLLAALAFMLIGIAAVVQWLL